MSRAYADPITPVTCQYWPAADSCRIAGTAHAGSALPRSALGLATAAASAGGRFMWGVVWAVACGEPAGRW